MPVTEVARRILQHALGWESGPLELPWEQLAAEDCSCLPLLAWGQQPLTSPRLKGALRHCWSRHQMLLRQAQDFSRALGEPLLLVDDLALASAYYPHPSARHVEGIDFVVGRFHLSRAAECLGDLGWRPVEWRLPWEYREWRSPSGDRLRLHLDGYPWPRADPLWAAARAGPDWSVIAPWHQWARVGFGAQPGLWLADAVVLLEHFPEDRVRVCAERGLAAPLWRWNREARRDWGRPLLPDPEVRWGWRDRLLALVHRRDRLDRWIHRLQLSPLRG